jgi:hypothetical protein
MLRLQFPLARKQLQLAIPATASGFAGAAPGYRDQEELAALTSPDLRRQIAEAGVASGGFADAVNSDPSVGRNSGLPALL